MKIKSGSSKIVETSAGKKLQVEIEVTPKNIPKEGLKVYLFEEGSLKPTTFRKATVKKPKVVFLHEEDFSNYGGTLNVIFSTNEAEPDQGIQILLIAKNEKFWRRFLFFGAENLRKKKEKILKYVLFTILTFGLILSGIIYGGGKTNILLAILSGAVIFWRLAGDKKYRLAYASLYIVFIAISGTFFSDILVFGILSVFFSLFFYLLEEAAYKPTLSSIESKETVEEGGKKKSKVIKKRKVSWDRQANLYPAVPVMICLGMVIISFFIMFSEGWSLIGNNHVIPDTITSGLGKNYWAGVGESLKGVAKWLFAAVLITLWSSPGEFLSYVRGSKKVGDAMEVLEKGVLIKEATDIIRWVTKRK